MDADADKMIKEVREINHAIDVLKMSLKTREGFGEWIGFVGKSMGL